VGDALTLEARGGDLVEERLERVVVALVDDDDLDGVPRERAPFAQRTCGAEAAESCTKITAWTAYAIL